MTSSKKQKSNDEIPFKYVEKKKKTTSLMTRYELCSILNARAVQIATGRVKPDMKYIQYENEGRIVNDYNPINIAFRELVDKKIDLIVKRLLPDGSYEYWNVQDLDIPAL